MVRGVTESAAAPPPPSVSDAETRVPSLKSEHVPQAFLKQAEASHGFELQVDVSVSEDVEES